MFVVKNKDSLRTNSDIHSFNTILSHDLHIPVANLAVFQKAVWYSGTKVYNQQYGILVLKFITSSMAFWY